MYYIEPEDQTSISAYIIWEECENFIISVYTVVDK